LADAYLELETHPDWQQLLFERYAMEYEASRDIQALWDVLRHHKATRP
jgi:RNAse (barnase) inhibitor barstar